MVGSGRGQDLVEGQMVGVSQSHSPRLVTHVPTTNLRAHANLGPTRVYTVIHLLSTCFEPGTIPDIRGTAEIRQGSLMLGIYTLDQRVNNKQVNI